MPKYTSRQRLKKRALDRWENEGGRIYADSKEVRGETPNQRHVETNTRTPTAVRPKGNK